MEKTGKAPNSLERAAKIVPFVELKDIFMLEGDFFRSREFLDEAKSVDLKFDISTKVTDYDKKHLEIGVHLLLSSTDCKTDVKHFQVRASYCLTYDISPKGRITKKDREAFGAVNGVYNCWPYWREFVQSATLRLNLPPLTLQVLRIPRVATQGRGQEMEGVETQKTTARS
jgi:preprotein translocase subunit SecB